LEEKILFFSRLTNKEERLGANVQHMQNKRQGAVIYLLACLSYIDLTMGSLADQHRRLQNS